MDKEKITPYQTATGIKIGCFYQPKNVYELSRDMELLQGVLLGDGKDIKLEKLKSAAYVVGVCAFVLFLLALTK